MLADVRDYLVLRRVASLRDLALHFDSSPEAMRDMLGVWLRKGRVRQVDATEAAAPAACSTGDCGGACRRCAAAGPEGELYAWVEAGTAASPPHRVIALHVTAAA